MWFKMPTGCKAIAVERQEFRAEVTDAQGVNYFRAPDHFAARIIAIPGFIQAMPPEGSPEDLPKADPIRDSAIGELTGEVTSLRMEVQNLRSDLGSAQARNTALAHENAALQQEMAAKIGEILGLQERLEDAGIAPAEVVPLKKAK